MVTRIQNLPWVPRAGAANPLSCLALLVSLPSVVTPRAVLAAATPECIGATAATSSMVWMGD